MTGFVKIKPSAMKKLLFMIAVMMLVISLFTSCFKDPLSPQAKTYPSDVAVAWMNLHMKLTMTTPGFNSIVSDRSFAYAGLTLYESVVPGMKDYQSIAMQLGNVNLTSLPAYTAGAYFWPASANAAMASITRSLFASTSVANMTTIDSLEKVFHTQFQSESSSTELNNSEAFGKQVATAIFEWSKTDGGHEANLHVTSASYIPPTGPGLWIPTPPAFGAPIHPYWGNNRSFVPGIAAATQPAAPIAYSDDPTSPFYAMVNELYTISLSLTHEDSTIVKFWGDLPVNFNVPAHATSILSQLVVSNHLKLDKAAFAYVKHGMAMYDASISVMKTKYTYNLIRPVSYIRGVMNHPGWNSVIPTPPHPEYSAAHAVISGAAVEVLEDIFGTHYSFTDHSYDNLYGARTYASFDDYAKEAGHSRVLGGLHYKPSVMIGLIQGRKVCEAVNKLHFQKNGYGK